MQMLFHDRQWMDKGDTQQITAQGSKEGQTKGYRSNAVQTWGPDKSQSGDAYT